MKLTTLSLALTVTLVTSIGMAQERPPATTAGPPGELSPPSNIAPPTTTLTRTTEIDESFAESEQELLRLFQNAPPIPMPQESRSTGSTNSDLVKYNPETGETTVVPSAQSVDGGARQSDGFAGTPPQFSGDGAADHGPTAAADQETDGSYFTSITPSLPSEILNTTSVPWIKHTKMLMRFGTSYYVCSASLASRNVVITAGHCIYNHSEGGWADEVWVYAAQTDRVYPDNLVDYPYSIAHIKSSSTMQSYSAWTNSADLNWDWGWVELDRDLGNRVGWMGRETNNEFGSLNLNGYPAEGAYGYDGRTQYYGYDAGNVRDYTSHRIEMDAYTFGGHSGGPVWRLSSGVRRLQGVNSTSNRAGYAEATLLTNTIFDDTTAYVAAATASVARPDIIEYTISTTAKDLLDNSAEQGESIDIKYNGYNAGFASSTVTFDFYLSTNTTITTFDTLLGTRTHTLGANTFTNPTSAFTVPSTLPAGTYYVGWIMTSSVAEYSESGSNTVIIGPEQLTVTESIDPPAAANLLDPSGTISEVAPTYAWDPVADATHYYLYITGPSGVLHGQWYSSAAAVCGGGTCKVVPAIADLEAGNHTWWVRTWNSGGGYGPWSSAMNFTVQLAGPPDATTLTAPIGGVTASSATPTYSWDAVSDATYYALWVSDTTGVVINAVWYSRSAADCASGTGTCSVTPATSLANGAVTWYVLTWNSHGQGPWSSAGNFYAPSSAVPPVATTLVSPVSGDTVSANPTYTWNAVSNSTYYRLWVNDTNGNAILQWYSASAAGCASGTGTCSITPTTSLASGTGTWWVQTWNSYGYGPWSSGGTFNVAGSTPPVAATLVSPIGGATVSANPTYTWNAVSNSTYYYLWVNDSGGNAILQWYTAAAAGCASGTGTCSITPTTSLASGNGIWWIQTWNTYGYGPWSSGGSFYVP